MFYKAEQKNFVIPVTRQTLQIIVYCLAETNDENPY